MIFYTANNIKIGRFAKMQTNRRMVLRWDIPVPQKWIEKAANKINLAYNKTNNKTDSVKLLDEYHKLSLANKYINTLPTIYLGFMACYKIHALSGKPSPLFTDFEKLFEEARGFKPTEADILAIPAFIQKLKNKYDDLFPDEPAPEPKQSEPFDFDYYVYTLGKILHPLDVWNERLPELHKLNEMALKATKKTKP